MIAPYGLIGEHLSHSFSPEVHNKLVGIPFDLMPMPPQDLEHFFTQKKFSGITVTIPYKKAVIPLCDALTPAAQRIGSVNTVLHRSDDTLLGHNTDYDGFLYLLRCAGANIQGRKCLILGNGGVSPTVRVALEDLQAGQIFTISRSGVDNYDNLDRHADAQIIVNTTPVGMYPKNGVAPLDLTQFPHCEGVYDLIYNPVRTQLMLDADRLGIPNAGGLTMLVAQAAAADELFLDTKVPSEAVDALVAQMERNIQNIMLVGMPGSGKSTVGQRLAAQLNRKFVDTDALIQEKIGTTIPDFFATQGEDAFRQVEHEILEEISRQSGLIIATGGGIVIRPENHDLLRQNSTVVFLQRPLEELPIHGRPVSQSVPLETLYAQRLPLYRQLCDLEVVSQQGIAHTINQITEGLQR